MRPKPAVAALAAWILTSPVPGTAADSRAHDGAKVRDPFRPTLTMAEPLRGNSLAALRGDEVRLRGFVRTSSGPAALLAGHDPAVSLLAREGDELHDALVLSVDYEKRAVVLRIANESPLRPWRDRILRLPAGD